jgi:Protein of unknown function (DUF2892).
MNNVGSLDRMLRILAGLVLLAVALLPPLANMSIIAGLGPWKWALVVVGVVMLATGLTRSCPAYTLLGVRTNGRR